MMSLPMWTSPMTLVLTLTLISPILLVFSRPGYIGCENSTECGAGFCCVIGTGRFSIPECVSLGDIGSKCLTGIPSSPQNISVSYPDGESQHLTNVYRLFCPCSFGLSCKPESNVCIDATQSNRIDLDGDIPFDSDDKYIINFQ